VSWQLDGKNQLTCAVHGKFWLVGKAGDELCSLPTFPLLARMGDISPTVQLLCQPVMWKSSGVPLPLLFTLPLFKLPNLLPNLPAFCKHYINLYLIVHKPQYGFIMLAANKENDVLHVPHLGKVNTKTPGPSKLHLRTPYKVPLNDENIAGKTSKKTLFVGKDSSLFVTPIGEFDSLLSATLVSQTHWFAS